MLTVLITAAAAAAADTLLPCLPIGQEARGGGDWLRAYLDFAVKLVAGTVIMFMQLLPLPVPLLDGTSIAAMLLQLLR
jgi:hypothetical protein